MPPTDETLRRWEGKAAKIARGTVPENDRDDAINDGLLAVWLLSDKWVPSEESWSDYDAWMGQRVKWAMQEGQRSRTHSRRTTDHDGDAVRIDAPLPWLEHGSNVTWAGVLRSSVTDDPERRALAAEWVREFLEALTVEDRAIVDALLAGATMREYGESIGVTESRISQRVRNIRRIAGPPPDS